MPNNPEWSEVPVGLISRRRIRQFKAAIDRFPETENPP